MSVAPWYAQEDWSPPGVRQLGNDFRMEHDLRAWTFGKPLTPGLPFVYDESLREDSGHLLIRYDDGRKYGADHGSWSVSVRQTVTGRDVAVYGAGSLTSALEDCLGMVRDYERDDLLEFAMPGLS